MGGQPASSTLNSNDSVNQFSPINLGGAINIHGSVGNGDVTQNAQSSATGGSYNIGVSADISAPQSMPGLLMLSADLPKVPITSGQLQNLIILGGSNC